MLPAWPYPDRPGGSSALGDESIEAEAGEVVVAPPETPHRFEAIGSERLRMVTVHASPRMETVWLED